MNIAIKLINLKLIMPRKEKRKIFSNIKIFNKDTDDNSFFLFVNVLTLQQQLSFQDQCQKQNKKKTKEREF